MGLLGARHAGYARETAACVDFAYDAMEQDIRRELANATGSSVDALERLLLRLKQRRQAIERFMEVTAPG